MSSIFALSSPQRNANLGGNDTGGNQMRSADGMHFENVVGIADRNVETGEEFRANVFDCNKPMVVGDHVRVGDKIFQYRGEDSLGCSLFTAEGQTAVEAALGISRSLTARDSKTVD
jgi:hypothetical protein